MFADETAPPRGPFAGVRCLNPYLEGIRLGSLHRPWHCRVPEESWSVKHQNFNGWEISGLDQHGGEENAKERTGKVPSSTIISQPLLKRMDFRHSCWSQRSKLALSGSVTVCLRPEISDVRLLLWPSQAFGMDSLNWKSWRWNPRPRAKHISRLRHYNLGISQGPYFDFFWVLLLHRAMGHV